MYNLGCHIIVNFLLWTKMAWWSHSIPDFFSGARSFPEAWLVSMLVLALRSVYLIHMPEESDISLYMLIFHFVLSTLVYSIRKLLLVEYVDKERLPIFHQDNNYRIYYRCWLLLPMVSSLCQIILLPRLCHRGDVCLLSLITCCGIVMVLVNNWFGNLIR